MKKFGFMLIELLITLVIASFLMLTLHIILSQLARAKTFAQQKVEINFIKNAFVETITQDFSGMILLYQIKKEEKNQSIETSDNIPLIMQLDENKNIKEFTFTTINYREYQEKHIPTEVSYMLKKNKDTKHIEIIRVTKNKKENFAISFLQTIQDFKIQFIIQKQNQTKDNQETKHTFEIVNEWPTNQEMKKTKTDQEKKQSSLVSHIKIIFSYIEKEGQPATLVTLLIPIYYTNKESNKDAITAKQDASQLPVLIPQKENSRKPTLAEKRASHTLEMMLKGMTI